MATEIRENFKLDQVAQMGEKIASKYHLPTDREATRDEILHCNYSFPQLLGRNGDTDQVAALSFGLAGRVETLEPVMEGIRRGLGRVEWYGRDQVAVFIEEDVNPIAMVGRLIDGPKEVYQNLHGLKTQVSVQEDRRHFLLESPDGKGRQFEEIFNGKRSAAVKGYQGDGTAEFLLGYVVRGRTLWGTAIDDQPQSMT